MITLGALLADEEEAVLLGSNTPAHDTHVLSVGVLVRLTVVHDNLVRHHSVPLLLGGYRIC